MKEDWKHITQESSCPSLDELEQYSEGRLPESKRFAIENHLAGCDACNDYLDGLAVLPENLNLDSVEKELKQGVRAMFENKQKRSVIPVLYRRLAVAASILLVLGTSVYLFFNKEEMTPQLSEQIISEYVSSGKIAENKDAMVKAEPSAPIVSGIAQNIPQQAIQVKSKSKSADLEELENYEMLQQPNPPIVDELISEEVVEQEMAEVQIIIDENDATAASLIIEKEEEIEVTLQPSEMALDEVVVVGYGAQSKVAIVGAASGNRFSGTSKATDDKMKELNATDKANAYLSDSINSLWAATKLEIQKQLLLKDRPALVLNLNELMKLTNNKAKQDSILMAIGWAEAGKFRKVEKLIEVLEAY